MARVRGKTCALRKDPRPVPPAGIKNCEGRLQISCQAAPPALCLSQRAFISPGRRLLDFSSTSHNLRLDSSKTPNKFPCGASERRLGVHAQLACKIDHAKQEISQFLLDVLTHSAGYGLAQFLDFLLNLVQDLRSLIPIKADPGRLFLRMLRSKQGWECGRRTIHHGAFSPFFRAFDLLPLPEHLRAFRGSRISENMRMAPDELLANPLDDLLETEGLSFARHVRVHDYVKKQIAQFLSQISVIRLLYGLDGLVAFLDERRTQAFMRLLPIPRATSGRTKPGDDFPQSGDVAHITRARACFGLC